MLHRLHAVGGHTHGHARRDCHITHHSDDYADSGSVYAPRRGRVCAGGRKPSSTSIMVGGGPGGGAGTATSGAGRAGSSRIVSRSGSRAVTQGPLPHVIAIIVASGRRPSIGALQHVVNSKLS